LLKHVSPINPTRDLYLGICHFQLSRIEDAERHLLASLKHDPNNSEVI
jgi:hypothetical protein